MATPNAYLPREVEDAQLASYRAMDTQLQEYARDSRSADRAQRLMDKYTRHPWLSPGIATSFVKWEEQYGTPAAKGLAHATWDASTAEGADKKSINAALEDYVAKADFQSQVKKYRESQQPGGPGLFEQVVDAIPVVGMVKGIVEGASPAEVAMRVVPGVQATRFALNQGAEATSHIPVVGPAVRAVPRAALIGLESPYQEVQGLASRAGVAAAQAVGAEFRRGVYGDQGNAPLSGSGTTGEAVQFGGEMQTAGEAAGLHVSGKPFEPVSTAAIALEHLANGEPVDAGTGFFPGGALEKEHTSRVRDIGYFNYNGGRHFATPGRLLASLVTEPGTDPYNVLSGTVDATAILTADPTNYALIKASEIKAARQGFAVAESTIAEREAAGGFGSWVRSFVDPPTVDRYLASKTGTALKEDLALNFGPEQFAELGRRTNWKWPHDIMVGVTEATTPEQVDSVLRQGLGTSIDRQPVLRSTSAAIRNVTGKTSWLSELPGRRQSLAPEYLGGENGSLRAIYNHGLGIGLDDAEISTHLFDIAASSGRVERSVGMINYMEMEKAALIKMGLPADKATEHTRFAFQDLFGNAHTYFDDQIAHGTDVPGVIIEGAAFPTDKPYTLMEHLGDTVVLPKTTGKGSRAEAIAQYGRIFGIPGTGFTDLDGAEGVKALTESTGRAVQKMAYSSNAALVGFQNRVWKPLALIRGAWMLRVLGEEQIRMTMAGYDTFLNHPIRYFSLMAAKKRGSMPDLLDWAAEQGGLRHAMAGSFGITDPAVSSYGRILARYSKTFTPEDAEHAAQWADKLTQYANDPVLSEVAKAVHAGKDALPVTSRALDTVPGSARTTALDDLHERFWDGDLANLRSDLAHDPNFAANGIDLNTIEGANRYIDGAYDRVIHYTGGDGNLIFNIATGKYFPEVETLAKGKSLRGMEVTVGDQTGEVIAHRKGSGTAKVLLAGEGEPVDVAVSQLDIPGGTSDILRIHDGRKVIDSDFVGQLRSHEGTKPSITGEVVKRADPEGRKFVEVMFGALMDRPTSYLHRSQAFMQEYYNQLERLLPHMDPEAQAAALREARQTLMGGGRISQHALGPRYEALVNAAKSAPEAGINHAEAEFIAKAHALDTMRDLLYDLHRRNKTLGALQLLFPFGEAWKEMWGSWARIVVDRPQTVRRFQVLVNGARGANPFDYVPGAIPDAYKGQGFFYKDPQGDGSDKFVYPWSAPINEALTSIGSRALGGDGQGVYAPSTARAQDLSIGFALMPGVGPAFQAPAMFFLDRYLSNPKWDPLRRAISPYGEQDLSSGPIEKLLLPAWMQKWVTAVTGNPNGGGQSAKVLNNMMGDLLAAGQANGEYDLNSPEGMAAAVKDAEQKARLTYALRGTFQFGAPAAPSPEFMAKTKNGDLVRLSALRDAYYKLVDKDPDTATVKFVRQFGENALYVTAPKTFGTVFGQEFTKSGDAWKRTHGGIVTDYPTAYAEFIPPNDDKFDYNAYIRAANTRTPISAKDGQMRISNVLGAMWYDKVRTDMGLKDGQAGTYQQRLILAKARNDIHEGYPGFRRVVQDDSRIPTVVEELTTAAYDTRIKKANPALYDALHRYVEERNWALGEAARRGGINDFTRPGFSTGNKYADIRDHLRWTAEELGKDNPQFLALWEDTFQREMKDDDG